MANLIYTAIASLDGYVADDNGKWDWSIPSDEVHAFVSDLTRPIGTHLYGRRMYDVLVAWETMDTGPEQRKVIRDFAEIWRAADKVVYSRTLAAPASARTRIEREFNPEAVRQMKAEADRNLTIGGPELAGQALRAGDLVDEIHLLLSPAIVGGGNRALPHGARIDLELLAERRFANGVVFVRYGVCQVRSARAEAVGRSAAAVCRKS